MSSDLFTVVINKTPHALTIVGSGGQVITWPKPTEKEKAVVPRVDSTQVVVGLLGGCIEDIDMEFGEILHYPKNLGDGSVFVVSRLFIEACKKANMDVSHLRSPGRLLRDGDGNVIGAEGLAR